MVILGSPQILTTCPIIEAKLGGSWALSNTNPGSLKPDSRDPETETGNLETGKRVHRIHDTLETGLHMMPRSLVAPSRGLVDFHREFVKSLIAGPLSILPNRYLMSRLSL